MPSRRLKAAVAVLAVAASAVVGFELTASNAASPISRGETIAVVQPTVSASGPGPVASAAASAAFASSQASPKPELPLGSNQMPDLQADAAGNLVVDVHTRDELERLLALNGRAEAQALLQQLQASLPPMAYRQAVDSFYAFQNYAIAAAQLTPAAAPVADEASALRQLDALHALRADQFGAAAAQAYFGDEETTARALIATMQAHPESGNTLTERAEQAQAPGRAR